MAENNRQYTNGEITVFWKPELCIHVEYCFRKLPRVFNPKKRPWVNMEGSTTDKIIEAVKLCPTNALSYKYNQPLFTEPITETKSEVEKEEIVDIKMLANGPFIVTGKFTIADASGNKINMNGKTALCRCGASNKMPFCDGNHRNISFKG